MLFLERFFGSDSKDKNNVPENFKFPEDSTKTPESMIETQELNPDNKEMGREGIDREVAKVLEDYLNNITGDAIKNMNLTQDPEARKRILLDTVQEVQLFTN